MSSRNEDGHQLALSINSLSLDRQPFVRQSVFRNETYQSTIPLCRLCINRDSRIRHLFERPPRQCLPPPTRFSPLPKQHEPILLPNSIHTHPGISPRDPGGRTCHRSPSIKPDRMDKVSAWPKEDSPVHLHHPRPRRSFLHCPADLCSVPGLPSRGDA